MGLSDDLISIFKRRPSFIIDSKEKLEEAALKFGVLPFFENPVKGLSVDELCAPGLLFGGNFDEGCWEWKGPVIRRRTTGYGKFFRRKAGFVSLDLLPDFLNYRRGIYPVKPDSTEDMILEIIRENDGMTSTELKSHIFGDRHHKRNWDEIPDYDKPISISGKRKSLEGPLQRLQMGGWLLISDFEYKRTKNGERYGWGVARYSTPELNFGKELIIPENKSAEQSFSDLVSAVKSRWPAASSRTISQLLR